MSRIKPEVAQRRIKSFNKRFGVAHLYFAYHAAFPLALTPDLLYRLWVNFQQDIHGKVIGIPWIAVADLLLSSLCDEVGHELYEIDLVVRNKLLKELETHDCFGKERINQLSNFLLEYVRQQLLSDDPDIQDFAKTQQWVALAYTQPSQAARELALAFSKLDEHNKAELLRIASLTETLAEPLAQFQPLLIYARGMGKFAHGDLEAAKTEFGEVFKGGKYIQFEGILLPVPDRINLKSFSFETITVDARGNVTNRRNCQAKYFIEDLGNGVTLQMIQIPEGIFNMGSPPGEAHKSDHEGPQRQVTLPEFFIGKYEVTQAQYEQVMYNSYSYFNGKKRPVEKVSWNDAVKFCKALSQKTGRIYRLPSEAEWEYACRAGTTTPFYFGETITTHLVNYKGNNRYAYAPEGEYRQQTKDVGSFPPNSFGLYDMHGNVWEWCQDTWHNNYEGAPTDGSAWIDNNNRYRLLRGGSWDSNLEDCRCANRYYFYLPDDHINFIGLRVVYRVAPRS